MHFRFNNEVTIPLTDAVLTGELVIPLHAEAIILFSNAADGNSTALNKLFAANLQQQHFGTLRFSLLTENEALQYQTGFDVNLLTKRLYNTVRWLQQQPAAQGCTLGLLGSGIGAAAALKASIRLPEIEAVVCKAGRPDLVLQDLPQVKVPVLLIAGSYDTDTLALNRTAYNRLTCRRRLDIIEHASHLFEEDGKIELAEKLAAKWLGQHLLMADHKVHRAVL